MGKPRKKSVASAAIVALTAAIVAGSVVPTVASANNNNPNYNRGGNATDPNNRYRNYDNQDWRRQDWRVANQAVWREYVGFDVPSLRSLQLQTPDFQPLSDALNRHTQALGDTVEAVYPGTRDDFIRLWRQHTNYFNDYMNASKANDQAGRQQARQNLARFADEMGNLLSTRGYRGGGNYYQRGYGYNYNNNSYNYDRNYNYFDNYNNYNNNNYNNYGYYRGGRPSQSVLTQQLTRHNDQFMSIIDNFAGGDFPSAYRRMHEAYDQMGNIADTLSLGTLTYGTTSNPRY